ncbi:MAG: DeoR/GlpR transcriptional regulator [Conexibacter sp.]|nr:DeoR/GlpR transcriptional regulator [Conexibacter sp.]
MRVESLVETLGVSTATVRRDLQQLDNQGLLTRVFGGARLVTETSFAPRAQAHVTEKARIAKRAAALVAPGETIAMETGTTVLAVASGLDVSGLTVVTNSVDVLLATQPRTDIKVLLTGGAFEPTIRSLYGPLVERFYAEHQVDRLFIGAGSVSREGLRDSNIEAIGAKRAAIASARRTVVVADSSKFELTALTLVAPWSQITTLVTDAGAPEAELDAVRAAGVEVIVA